MTDSHEMGELVGKVLRDLERVPSWPGISFRGRQATDVFGVGRRTVVTRGLIATSRDPRVATENFTTPGLFAILGTQGRAIETISQHPHEQEVVFLPSSLFVMAAVATVGDLDVVVVRQVDLAAEDPADPAAKDQVREAGPVIGRFVEDARARPAVAVTSPGKYAGDID